jgi:hypothetical protein
MFALILAFFVWAASQEAQEVGAPVSTATGGIPTQPVMTPQALTFLLTLFFLLKKLQTSLNLRRYNRASVERQSIFSPFLYL